MRYILVKMVTDTFVSDGETDYNIKSGEQYLLREVEGLEWPEIYIDEVKDWFDYCSLIWEKQMVITDEIYHNLGKIVKIIEVKEDKQDIDNIDNEFWEMVGKIHHILIEYDVYPNATDLVNAISSLM